MDYIDQLNVNGVDKEIHDTGLREAVDLDTLQGVVSDAEAATTSANEAAEAALAAVVTAELPAVATESNVRNIVKNYTPSA